VPRQDATVGEIRPSRRKTGIEKRHLRMLGILTVVPTEATVMHGQRTGRDLRQVLDAALEMRVIPAAAPPSCATARVLRIKRDLIDTAVETTGVARTKSLAGAGGRRGAGSVDVTMTATRRGNRPLVITGRGVKREDLPPRRMRT
jgi:hypothetical protein